MDHKPEQEHLIGYDEFDQAGKSLIKKRKWKHRMGLAAIGLGIVIVAGGSLAVFLTTRQESDAKQQFAGRGEGGFGGGGQDMITAAGTTSIGMDEVVFEIDFLENTSLYVEEVYISSQDEVEADTKILKFTQESIDEARAELEETLQNAQLSYRSSTITTKESEIQAQYTYEQAVLTANQAQDVYDDTLAALLVTLNQAQSDYEDAQEAYDELYQQIADNTFYADYEIAEKKKAYEDALDLYETKCEDWEVTEDELSSASSASSNSMTMQSSTVTSAQTSADGEGEMSGEMAEGMAPDMSASGATETDLSEESENEEQETTEFGMQGTRGNSERQWILKTVKLLKEEAEEAEQEYEEAQEEYEDAIEHAELNLKTLWNQLEQAKAAYTEADLEYQKEVLSAKTTYQTALAKNQTAQNDYDTQLTSLDEALEKLKDEMDEAQENLDTFEATVGDGYLYTTEAGTVLMIRAQEGEVLAGDDMIMAYSKPDEITVSVSVSQDSIAQLNVGDTATVMFNDYGTFSGTITSINPVSSSSSRTSVAYTVQVSLEGDVSELEANLTATVMFGEMPEMSDMPQEMNKQEETGNE